jgi:ABC-type Na+ transport system ATPase subunit NatA
MGSAIRTERLTKTYGKNRGISDVDLEVLEGEVFGFLGPNGAGTCPALLHRRTLAVAIPAIVLFGMCLVDALGKVSEDLEVLRPASVFYYYGSAIEDGIDWTSFAGITLAALAFVALATLAFRRRDIYT